ncbi:MULTISPECIES: S8 family serine peptidase [unclassified Pseudoalteromonas]|uniref:S8 family serine peptidase n=1 Tax=unclassified Pseudoalteromonas TaxID=194690 RepID=UPI000694E7A5|nr:MULTISPECIES: S8 family serine peptidase [unclassified Pseudoalteromonas]
MNVVVDSAKQWVLSSGTLKAVDSNGDALNVSFTENGETIIAENGVYTFSHGVLELSGLDYSYVSLSGEAVEIDYVVSALEIRHEDLEPNVLPNRSLNIKEGATDKTDPSPTSITGDHGTSVAGLIAAKGWNGLGGRGVAPDTSLIDMNYLGGGNVPQTEYLIHGFPGSGIAKSDNVGVFNRSYGLGWPTHFSYSELDEAIESYPNLNLRDGKGAVTMKSSGNSFGDDGNEGSLYEDNGANELGLTCYNASFESSQIHPYYLSVAAVNSDGRHTSYSTAGANVFVSAPSGEFGRYAPAMVTTDQMTCLSGYSGFTGRTIAAWTEFYGEEFVKSQFPFNFPGHEENASCNYTSTFNGTSSAAPNASGVVALILSANSELTWRDVRHILASTSSQNDADNAEGLVYKVEVTEELALEAMQFKFDISNVDMNYGLIDGTQTTAGMDLAIEVTSPSGTKSVILSSKQAITYPAYSFENGEQPGYILKDGVLLSNAFYGESSKGEWTIRILDTSANTFATSDGGQSDGAL